MDLSQYQFKLKRPRFAAENLNHNRRDPYVTNYWNIVMNRHSIFIPSALALCLSVPVIAQEENSITREIELGALFTSGNTEEESINFAGAINIIRDQWEYGFTFDALRSSSEGEVKGQRFYAVAQANYNVTDYSYFQTRLAHEDDRFSGFDSQSDLTFSYGRELLRNRDNMTLNASAGVGARYSELAPHRAALRLCGASRRP